MIRKNIIILGAAVALGAAALAPTAASAGGGGWHGHHHHWHGGYGYGFGIGFGPTYVAGPDCYVVKRLIDTPYGPRWRRVTVCD